MYSFTQIDLTKAKILFKVLRWLLYSESPCSSIQYPIDIFRISRWRPPPSWIFKLCEFRTFRHVNSVVLEICAKFGSNICCSHWDRRVYALIVHLMTSRELTSGFDFCHVVISLWTWYNFPPILVVIFLCGDISISKNSRWPPSAILNLLERSGPTHEITFVVRYVMGVPL